MFLIFEMLVRLRDSNPRPPDYKTRTTISDKQTLEKFPATKCNGVLRSATDIDVELPCFSPFRSTPRFDKVLLCPTELMQHAALRCIRAQRNWSTRAMKTCLTATHLAALQPGRAKRDISDAAVAGLGYVVPDHLHLSGPLRPARGHIATSPRSGLYAMPSLCGSA
jgi:hypothetical protein